MKDDATKRKVALVTGATGGVGGGICHALRNHGYYVVVAYKSRAQKAVELVSELRNAIALPLDIADDVSIESAITQIEKKIGRLDVLVNNAGILAGLIGPIKELTRQQLQTMFAVHIVGTIRMTAAALPLLQESKAGRIINISSVHGISGGRPGLSAYATAKAAIIGFTKAASKELAPKITVNAIAPGFVNAGMTELMSPELKSRAKSHIPMRRFAKPIEIGEAVAFLASNDTAYITGQTLIVSGGKIESDIDPYIGSEENQMHLKMNSNHTE